MRKCTIALPHAASSLLKRTSRDGTVAPGMVMLANVTLGPYTVNNQAIGTSSENPFATHVLTSVRIQKLCITYRLNLTWSAD